MMRRLRGNPGKVTQAQLSLNPGDLVDVQTDPRGTHRGEVIYCPPYRLGGDGPWVAHVSGLAGCYLLERITPVDQQVIRF